MKKKGFNIDNVFCLERNKIIIEGENVTAKIVDEELDVIDCTFHNDGCVHLETKDYAYLTLSRSNLEMLLGLIDDAENEIDLMFN